MTTLLKTLEDLFVAVTFAESGEYHAVRGDRLSPMLRGFSRAHA